MLMIHNLKVQKILTRHLQLHEDKQNGIIRIPSATPAKQPKKKKFKKTKKSAPVDVTIKFKDADGHIEEIVVKEQAKKKKKLKTKKKASAVEGEDETSDMQTEDLKESAEEEDTETVTETEAQPEKTVEALRKS
jgi:hypothetical protein